MSTLTVPADAPVDVLATRHHGGTAPTHYASGKPLSSKAKVIEDEIRTRYPLLRATAALSAVGVGNASRRLPGTDLIVLGGFAPYTPYGDGVPRTVTIDLNTGLIIEGEAHAGLIEVAPLYVATHRARPDIGSVLHTHSAHLSSYAVARVPLPLRLTTLREAFPGITSIPVTRWGTRYEPEPILDILNSHPGTPALIHGNHGPFVFAQDIAGAFATLALLEENAGIELLAARLAQN